MQKKCCIFFYFKRNLGNLEGMNKDFDRIEANQTMINRLSINFGKIPEKTPYFIQVLSD